VSVRAAWHDSEAFNRYRGDAWMGSTCGSCEQRHHDFGGCRCQAFLVTGDAAATDPVCPKSPDRGRIDDMLDAAAARRANGTNDAATHALRFVPGARRGADMLFRSDENSLACGTASKADTAPC